ncbi:WbqC family protein [Vibrio splendidus]|uniref:WbqC family protein n=1 Tax=Vibrio splendidus TaxID=29497 RepID=UPI000E09B0B3|nr:WbqC family protein [Vibrio splendidus]
MKIAIMQPYFFPYLGYFQLIVESDIFVLFDDVKYIHRGWINRNRVLKPNEGWQYIGVPLEKHSSYSLIKDIKIHPTSDWKSKIISQLEHYKKKAPYYKETIRLVEEILQSYKGSSIVDLNKHIIISILSYLDIKKKVLVSSQYSFDYSDVSGPGDWALSITKQLNGHEYINPIAGKDLFDVLKYTNSGIKLDFLSTDSVDYKQLKAFEPSLSIVDVFMFNNKEQVLDLLTKYKIEGEA